jgi:putative redox protein
MTEGWTEITADWKGVGPMQLLLAALAGCTGVDIVDIMRKKRAKLTDFQVRVRGKRAADYPMIWTDIHVTYLLWGEEIKPRDVEQAIRLSEEKYCSVGIMLGKSARITSEYHILKPGEKNE